MSTSACAAPFFGTIQTHPQGQQKPPFPERWRISDCL